MNKTTIANLNSFMSCGKNAAVLLQVAKAISNNKPLPAWASGFSKDHFTKVFALPKTKLQAVCSSHSYSELRSVLNAYSAGKMSKKLVATANELLKIQSFASLQDLKLAAAWVESADSADSAESADSADSAESAESAESVPLVTIEQVLSLFNQLSQADQLILIDTLNNQAALSNAA